MVEGYVPFITLIVGLVVGIIGTFVVILLTGFGAGKKAEKIISAAKKEADRNKRDALAELKQEQFKLKQEADKEVKREAIICSG